MHVVQLIDLLKIGGAQKLLVTFAAQPQVRNIKLTIISLNEDKGTSIPDELRALGVRVLSFPARKMLDPRRLNSIIRFLRKESVDIIHTHLGYGNIVGTIAGRLTGIPVISTLHSLPNQLGDRHPVRRVIEIGALRYGASSVVAVGNIVAETHQHILRGKPILVIPNAVADIPPLPSTERLALRRQLLDDPACPLVISVGRLSPLKGYEDLMLAFAQVHLRHPSAALVIVGGGSYHSKLEAFANRHQLNGSVKLLGTRDDVPSLLGASDIFVSASHLEGLPVAVLEAMSAGLPVVATSVGDVPYVVAEGTGLIVPPKDPAALASAICTMLDHPDRLARWGMAAKDRVEHNYSPEVWADKLLTLYQQTIAHRRVKEA